MRQIFSDGIVGRQGGQELNGAVLAARLPPWPAQVEDACLRTYRQVDAQGVPKP